MVMVYGHHIQDQCSIFTAEARAILLALECIEHSNRNRFVIFTNSISCLRALDHLKTDHPIISQILSKLNSLTATGFDGHLCWLPGHVGIPGNARADRAAKTACRTDMQPCLTPPLDFKPSIHKYITTMWQKTWDESPLNKITPIVSQPRIHHLSNRRDQSVFNRCQIGHSRLTYEFLLKGEPPPECIPCNCSLTIKHLQVLIKCVDFSGSRDFTRFPLYRTFLRPSSQKWFWTSWRQLRCTDFYELFDCFWMLLLNGWSLNDEFLFDALTCSRHKDGLSCWHGVKPRLTHSLCILWCKS